MCIVHVKHYEIIIPVSTKILINFLKLSAVFPVGNGKLIRETRNRKYILPPGNVKPKSVRNRSFRAIANEDLDNVHKLRFRRLQPDDATLRIISLMKSPLRRPRGNIRMPAPTVSKNENRGTF